MNPLTYFPIEFLKDCEKFGNTCLCAMTLSQIDGNISKWPYLEHFLICQYELNLIHQTIYAHFNEDYQLWLKIGIIPNDCRCSHGGFSTHPIRILQYAEQHFLEYNLKQKITKELLLEYDKLMLEYLEVLFTEGEFSTLNIESFKKALVNDVDNHQNIVKSYLESKV